MKACVDPCSPCLGVVRDGRLVVYKGFSSVPSAEIAVPFESFRENAVLSGEWNQWVGIQPGTSRVVSVGILTGEVQWQTELSNTACVLRADGQRGTIAVICDDDAVVYLDRRSGKVVARSEHVIDQWFNVRGTGRCTARANGQLLLELADGTGLRLGQSARNVLDVAFSDELVAIIWVRGGLTVSSLATGRVVHEISEDDLWITDMIWSSRSGTVLGFGSTDARFRGAHCPLEIGVRSRVVSVLRPLLAEQREFVCGQFYANGELAVLESGHIWKVGDDPIALVRLD